MEKALSICLPVYNEERCIGKTLESALDQTFDGKKEILIGANGCTDKTTEIVRNYSARYPEVRLVEITERGKPNTWNILRSQARNNLILFGDGDVHFDRYAFESLYDALNTGDKIAYGATNIPYLKESNWLVQILKSDSSIPQACLYGRLYGIDNSRTQKVLESRKIYKMPEDVILEDLWLSLAIGSENWEIEKSAKVYYTPYGLTEAPKMFRRQARGVSQIRKGYKELFNTEKNAQNPLSTANRFRRLRNTPGIARKVVACSNFLLHKFILTYAQIATRNENFANPLDGWEISEHSKQPIDRR